MADQNQLNDREYLGIGIKHDGESILIKFILPDDYNNTIEDAQWYFTWHLCKFVCSDTLALRFTDVKTLISSVA